MIIGITGSIATGKSTLTNYLRSKDYTVIDSDEIVHSLLTKPEILEKLVNIFGESLVIDGILDRKKLGEIVFRNEEKRQLLNNLIHPLVIHQIQEETKDYHNNKQHLIFVDIPLLFESGLEYLVDLIILVYVPKSIQLDRLMIRDNINMQYALEKIEASMDIELKKEKADYIIDNSLDKTNTYKQIDDFLRRIKDEN